MSKINYIELYHKALKGGTEMLKHAQTLDKLADANPNTEGAVKQRVIATILRQYYTNMFE